MSYTNNAYQGIGFWLCIISFSIGISYITSSFNLSHNNDLLYVFASSNDSTQHHSHSSMVTMNNFKFKFDPRVYLNSSGVDYDLKSYPNSLRTSVFQTLADSDKPLLCGDNKIHSNYYVKEFITPILCSQPVALTVDKDDKIWVASGKSGTIQVFDPKSEKFEQVIKIPNWPNQTRNIGSMIWDIKFDSNDNLWFTDELSNSIWKYSVNEGKFENYRLLSEGGYPLSIAFDSDNNVWFTQVFGKRLGFLEPSKVVSNTSKGISELDMSKQINFQTMGPISNGYNFSSHNDNNVSKDKTGEILWFSTAVFPIGGQIIKYDINNESITIHDINYTHSVPFSVAEDGNGTLWANSHIANLFLSLNPNTGAVKQYATSNPSSSGNLTTLPYYNEYRDGRVWFNEHYGNSIAYFDIKKNELVEYHLPSHNPLWVNSSNPLRFAFDNEGSIWFTEWTENKLGVIYQDKLNQLPISLNVSKGSIILDSKSGKGDSISVTVSFKPASTIPVTNSSDLENSQFKTANLERLASKPSQNVTFAVTSSISKDGKLVNMTSKFSDPDQSKFSNSAPDKQISKINLPITKLLTINPQKGVIPGIYTLTISAKYNEDITISRIIDLDVR
jgi:virginiamycin B lyase